MTRSLTSRGLYVLLFTGSLVSCQDNSENEANLPDPVVSSYIPSQTFEGETIVIHGENFGTKEENVEVYFYDNTAAVVNAVTNTTISVVVPNGAYVGPITVKVKEKEGVGPDFSVIRICMIGGHIATCPNNKPV